MKYRKKPVVIEAFQYNGDFTDKNGVPYAPEWAVKALENNTLYFGSVGSGPPCELFIATLEGVHHVSIGDYIIQGVQGELYPCKPDIFEKTYEEWHETAEEQIDSYEPDVITLEESRQWSKEKNNE